ncbi:hypothetical protein L3Y34_007170 [Caenorhabditis briggsae]|uniref:G-protein coupled receptors family 1 profile domain-containing protein n=1 Tax=Caenorhabditis briggsae TaxID=6238 RepID=A0AAE8ZY51_CAEBR|nr:hypothetical protein L3Y34_007170 [Caenorhabditis briggsae]
MVCTTKDPYKKKSDVKSFFFKKFNSLCYAIFKVYDHEVYFASACIILNFFHFAVLCRKPMRTSPIYPIMAFVALMDILVMLYDVNRLAVEIVQEHTDCFSLEEDFTVQQMEVFWDCFRNYARRCSTCLSFCITLIRVLVIKYPLNNAFSKPSTAIYFIIGVILLCAPIHLIDPYRFKIDRYEGDVYWNCDDYPVAYNRYYYIYDSEFYTGNVQIVAKVHKIADGTISKLLPSISAMIVTVILIRQMKRMKNVQSTSKSRLSRTTSKLVLALTIPYFFAALPLGVVCVLSPFGFSSKTPDQGLRLYAVLGVAERMFSVILVITTATHLIVCLLMSSVYRKTARSLIFCWPHSLRIGISIKFTKGSQNIQTASTSDRSRTLTS